MILNKDIAILSQEDMAMVIEGFIKEYKVSNVSELMSELEEKTEYGLMVDIDEERQIFVSFEEVYQFLSNEELDHFDGDLKTLLRNLETGSDESGFILQLKIINKRSS